MTKVKITPTDDGPYLVEGPVTVIDADGAAYDIPEQTTIFLCRCGNSGMKPFCDGTRETLNYEARNRAVHERDSRVATRLSNVT
jgi:CDGSH-type Zn-finger protein